jgi:uncharacterized membrane protein
MTVSFRLISRAATATAAAASALAYSRLEPRVATHFNDEDKPDRYSSRMGAALGLPGVMVGLSVGNRLFGAWPGSSDREDSASGSAARDRAIALIDLALLPAHLAILAGGTGREVNMRLVNRGTFGALLLALGNVLPKLPRNPLIGIRTPWTLADPTVWERTHRVGGYLVSGAGLVTLLSAAAPGRRAARAPLVASLAAVGISAAYSFAIRRRGAGHGS